jgi:DNA polymerase-3 subunit delta
VIVPADRLEAQIAGTLSPIYLISGDDPLLAGEAADRIRVRARDDGHTNRTVLTVDRSFDWVELAAAGASLSLFAEKQLIELRMPTGKPGVTGSKALKTYAANPPEDTVLLIISARLDNKSLKTAWVRALDAAGVVVQIWPLDRGRLPGWIAARMKRQGLQPGPNVADLIADRVEGNLLAADQEVQKLALLLDPGPVQVDDVLEAVADSARYDIFQLVDACDAGDAGRAHRILGGLRGEGTAPVLILWALVREIRALATVAWQTSHGAKAADVMSKAGIWPKRQSLARSALARHRLPDVHRLLRQAASVERIIKGAAPGDSWPALTDLIGRFAASGRSVRGEAA